MIKNLEEVWNLFELVNLSKVYISYSAKRKNPGQLIVNIENIIATCKNNDDSKLAWDNEIFKNKSFLTLPIYKEHAELNGKADGLLIYDYNKKKIILSGKYKKKITENYKIEMDNDNAFLKDNNGNNQ
jgi:hypothetical protein